MINSLPLNDYEVDGILLRDFIEIEAKSKYDIDMSVKKLIDL